MKTKFFGVALLAGAALIPQVNAGDHHHGGGHSAASASAAGRSAPASSFHSGGARNFGGGRSFHSGRHFSRGGMGQFYRGNVRHFENSRFGNSSRFTHNRNNSARHNGAIVNHQNRTGRVGVGHNLPRNWKNHVAARHSASWHRDWDRGRDHRWHGHHCRFINGSWVVFDLGFYPWSFGYPYGSYYGYNYYPYDYDPYYYGADYYGDAGYYGQNVYDSADAYADSSVAAAQQELARQGYYDGEIDGIIGPQTRRAISRYQSDHGQRVTGELTLNTLQSLGLREAEND